MRSIGPDVCAAKNASSAPDDLRGPPSMSTVLPVGEVTRAASPCPTSMKSTRSPFALARSGVSSARKASTDARRQARPKNDRRIDPGCDGERGDGEKGDGERGNKGRQDRSRGARRHDSLSFASPDGCFPGAEPQRAVKRVYSGRACLS